MALLAVNPGQIVQTSRNLGVVGAIAVLLDGQGAAEERLGLAQPVGVLEQRRQVVEADGGGGVVRATGFTGRGSSTPRSWPRQRLPEYSIRIHAAEHQ